MLQLAHLLIVLSISAYFCHLHATGFRLNIMVLKTKVVSQWIDCVMECASEACCRSINYKNTMSPHNELNCEMLHDVVYNASKEMLENYNTSYDYVYLVNPEKVIKITIL